MRNMFESDGKFDEFCQVISSDWKKLAFHWPAVLTVFTAQYIHI